MWEFDEDGELFYEKCVYGFLPELFDRWKSLGSNHVVSIVLFARVLYSEVTGDKEVDDVCGDANLRDSSRMSSASSSSASFKKLDTSSGRASIPIATNTTSSLSTSQDNLSSSTPVSYSCNSHALTRDSAGRLYRDFYRVVVDWEIKPDWSQVLIPLRREFMQFQKDILQQQRGDGSSALSGENSAAAEGNILEAVNLAMNPFDKHYIDRDLMRTGLSIVIVTAGSGICEVDKKLCRLTTQRMTDNGVALDLVSLSKPPLHTTPLFQFVSKDFVMPFSNASAFGNSTSLNSFGDPVNLGDNLSGSKINTKHSSSTHHPPSFDRQGPASSTSSSSKNTIKNSSVVVGMERLNLLGIPATSGGGSAASMLADSWDPLYYDDNSPENPDRVFFYEPLWVEISYWNRQMKDEKKYRSYSRNRKDPLTIGKGWEIKEDDPFINRCKMNEVQMMGIFEQIGSSVVVPYLDLSNSTIADVSNTDHEVVGGRYYSSDPFNEYLNKASMVSSGNYGNVGSSGNHPLYHGTIASMPALKSIFQSNSAPKSVTSPNEHQHQSAKAGNAGYHTESSSYSVTFQIGGGMIGSGQPSKTDLPYSPLGDFDRYDESLFHSESNTKRAILLRSRVYGTTLSNSSESSSNQQRSNDTVRSVDPELLRHLHQYSNAHPQIRSGAHSSDNNNNNSTTAAAPILQQPPGGSVDFESSTLDRPLVVGSLGRHQQLLHHQLNPRYADHQYLYSGTGGDNTHVLGSTSFAGTGGGSNSSRKGSSALTSLFIAPPPLPPPPPTPPNASSASASPSSSATTSLVANTTSVSSLKKQELMSSDKNRRQSNSSAIEPLGLNQRLGESGEDVLSKTPSSSSAAVEIHRSGDSIYHFRHQHGKLGMGDMMENHSPSSSALAPIRIKSPGNSLLQQQVTLRQSYRRVAGFLDAGGASGGSGGGSGARHGDSGVEGPSSFAAIPTSRHSFSGESFKGAAASPGTLDAMNRYGKGSPSRPFGSLPSRSALSQPFTYRQHINPCNPFKTFVQNSSQMERWRHVDISRPKCDLANWKSLCTPACLPLTTDFFPNPADLIKYYQEYTYTVSPADINPYQNDDANDDKKVASLLMELVAQRLSQGFQLTAQTSIEGIDSSSSDQPQDASSKHHSQQQQLPPQPQQQKNQLQSQPLQQLLQQQQQQYFLSLGDHVHQLGYDASGQNVEVKRYVRRVFYNTDAISYKCAIWPKNMEFYTPKTLQFAYPPLGSYNWNYLDHLISGYQEEMTESLRFWRTRFLLIPMENVPHSNTLLNPSNENLDEEELRLAGFHKFIELFEKAKLVLPHEMEQLGGRSRSSMRTINITLTTLNTSLFVHDELARITNVTESALETTPRRNSIIFPNILLGVSSNAATPLSSTPPSSSTAEAGASSSSSLTLTKNSPLVMIATSMLKNNSELSFKDRRWHFKLFEKVFIGGECVDWIVRNFVDIDSREDAVTFGNELMDRGFFQHIFNKHRFLDGHYFYRLSKEYMPLFNNNNGKVSPSSLSASSSSSAQSGVGVSAAGKWFARTSGGVMGKTPSSSGVTDFLETSSGDNHVNTIPNSNVVSSSSDSKKSSTTAVGLPASNTPSTSTSATASAASAAAIAASISNNTTTYSGSIELSRRLVIEMDPQQKSTRREIAILHYDTVHNPQNCYHFQLHWLVCTAKLIEDMLSSWTRVAEKCGLRLVEAPIEQAKPFADDNPFQSVVSIQLSLPPPSLAELKASNGGNAPNISNLWFEMELVKHHGFVLDEESEKLFPTDCVRYSYKKPPYKYIQYVHRSGVAFIQILESGGGFRWVNNRLLLTSAASSSTGGGGGGVGGGGVYARNTGTFSGSMVNPEALRAKFISFCASEEGLARFWQGVVDQIKVNPAS